MPVHGHLLEIELPRHRINCPDCHYPYEKLPAAFLENHKLTKDYANWIYQKAKVMTYSDIAIETGLSDNFIRTVEKEILKEEIDKREIGELETLGVDEFQVGKGHNYFTTVTDLDNEEVLDVVKGRKTSDLAPFYWSFRKKLKNVRWVVMDMWKGYIAGFTRFCKNTNILFDHFHIAKHLNDAMDKLRKTELKRLTDENKEIIKGKKWILLKRYHNLRRNQKSILKELLRMNRRLCKAYLLKEHFLTIWTIQTKKGFKRFWTNWKKNLRWQRLEPFVNFSRMIDKHMDGILSIFEREKPIKFGYIESLNTKIKLLIRKHRGYKDMELLKMKIIQTGSKSLKDYVPYPWVV